MATFTATRAAAGVQPFQSHENGSLCVAYGNINIATNPADGDIYAMCKVPKNATIIGGYVQADALDTHATPALDMDVGWAANGSEAADPDGLGNLGVWDDAAVADVRPEAGIYFPLGGKLLTIGPQTFTQDTTIQLEANTAAATFAAGNVTLVVFYVCP